MVASGSVAGGAMGTVVEVVVVVVLVVVDVEVVVATVVVTPAVFEEQLATVTTRQTDAKPFRKIISPPPLFSLLWNPMSLVQKLQP